MLSPDRLRSMLLHNPMAKVMHGHPCFYETPRSGIRHKRITPCVQVGVDNDLRC